MGDLKFQDITPASGKIKLGSTDVDAIYSGSTKVWPSDVSFGDIFFEATGETVQQEGQYTLWYATETSFPIPPFDASIPPYYPTTATFPNLSSWKQIGGVRNFSSCPDINPFDIAVPLVLNTSYFFQVRSLDGSLLYKFIPNSYTSPNPSPPLACASISTPLYTFRVYTFDVTNTRFATGVVVLDKVVAAPGEAKVRVSARLSSRSTQGPTDYELWAHQTTSPNAPLPSDFTLQSSATLLSCSQTVNFADVNTPPISGNDTIYFNYQLKNSVGDVIKITTTNSNPCSQSGGFEDYLAITVSNPAENNNIEILEITADDYEDPTNVGICGREWKNINSTETQTTIPGVTIPIAENATQWATYVNNGLAACCYLNFDEAYAGRGLIYNEFCVEVIKTPDADGGSEWRVPLQEDFAYFRSVDSGICGGLDFIPPIPACFPHKGVDECTNITIMNAFIQRQEQTTDFWDYSIINHERSYIGRSGLNVLGSGFYSGSGSFRSEGRAEFFWQNTSSLNFKASWNLRIAKLVPNSDKNAIASSVNIYQPGDGYFIRFVRDI